MPFNPKTNRWENTTRRLNRERPVEKNALKMSDEELLDGAIKDSFRNNFSATKRSLTLSRGRRTKARKLKTGTTQKWADQGSLVK